MKIILTLLFLLVGVNTACATTWYVRTDGSTGTNCTGTTNAAYPGSGTAQACALNSPLWVFPLRGESTTKKALPGDTVVIGTGSYRVGCQNATNCRDSSVNVTVSAFCDSAWPYDCYMNTMSSNITVIGCSLTGCGCTASLSSGGDWTTTCTTTRPEIWGAGRVTSIFNVVGTTGITIQDLELTDHATCGQGGNYGCGSSDSAELSAVDGINQGSSDTVYYKNLNIHGLYRSAFHGGSVGNHTYDNVRIFGNANAGIDYDSCNNDGTCGVTQGKYMRFINGTTVSWNGCVESSTSLGTFPASACFDQNNGGYGDGLGGTNSSGDWLVTDSDFSHNMSDGLDLLYLNRSGKTGGNLIVKRSRFEGNIGDDIKGDNNISVEDSYIIGNCAFFIGKSYTMSGTSPCRGGYAIAIANNVNSGSTVAKFYNNTVTSNFDVMFGAGTAGFCQGNFSFDVKNNLLLGGPDYNGGDTTGIFFKDCSTTVTFNEDYNTCANNFKESSPCPGAHSKNNIAPTSTYSGTISTLYTGTNYILELGLKSTSTAVGSASTSISGTDNLDYVGADRGVVWDMGAKEFTTGTSPVCGNGSIQSGEVCDDGNTNNGDGCNSTCTAVENGYSCTGAPSSCSPICGDGLIIGSEQCDDGNTTAGDGCTSACLVQSGWACSGQPSSCNLASSVFVKDKLSGGGNLSGKAAVN